MELRALQTSLPQDLPGPAVAHCAVCREPPPSDPVSCPRCGSLYHSECWRYNAGCAIYGCLPAPIFHISRAIRRSATQVLDLVPISNRAWESAPATVLSIFDERPVPFSSFHWKVAQALVLAASYVAIGGVCIMVSTPLLLIAGLHYFPPY